MNYTNSSFKHDYGKVLLYLDSTGVFPRFYKIKILIVCSEDFEIIFKFDEYMYLTFIIIVCKHHV